MNHQETRAAAGLVVFTLPDLGEGLAEATVVRWLVEVGDEVSLDQPIVEVESAKANVEIPCPYAGQVSARHGSPGDVLLVGSPLVTVRTPAYPVPRDGPDPLPLIGFGPASDGPAEETAGQIEGFEEFGTVETVATGRPANEVVRTISPVVRRLARGARLDLTTVRATGRGGVVRRADVERALRARGADLALLADAAVSSAEIPPEVPAETLAGALVGAPGAPSGPTLGGPPAEPANGVRAAGASASASADGIVRIPLRGRRGVIAERMARSRREIPEATTWRDVDATELLATRKLINAATPDRPVSVLGLIGRFCVAGLLRYPALNAHVDTARGEIVRHSRVHLGFAIAVDDGLTVAVVRDAQGATATGLTADVQRLTERARQLRLTAAEQTGGTFTVNNHGALGTDGAVPIINHPEVAQLAVGRIADRPWVVDGEIRPRKIVQLTITFDHRACDGAPIGGFLGFVAQCIEHPLTMLGEL